MISKIMNSINNHFIRESEYLELTLENSVITGTLSNTYLVGMYIVISGSYLNDGVYKITEVGTNSLTVDATLLSEVSRMKIYSSTPPKDFISLCTEIEAYKEKGVGVKSESIDDYSVAYVGDGSWGKVYSSKLNSYRRVYSDLI